MRPVVARIGERRALIFGLAAMSVGFLGYGLAPSSGWMWATIPVAALGGFYSPAAQGLMTRRVGASEQGRLQGALSGLLGIAALVSPFLYTQTFARSIDGSIGFELPGAPFLLAGALLAMATVVGWVATAPSAHPASS